MRRTDIQVLEVGSVPRRVSTGTDGMPASHACSAAARSQTASGWHLKVRVRVEIMGSIIIKPD
jgi:hypothetical protein|eukprot:SAG25_NODE_640_length_6239_cov_3.197557_6_plen_63_part_00